MANLICIQLVYDHPVLTGVLLYAIFCYFFHCYMGDNSDWFNWHRKWAMSHNLLFETMQRCTLQVLFYLILFYSRKWQTKHTAIKPTSGMSLHLGLFSLKKGRYLFIHCKSVEMSMMLSSTMYSWELSFESNESKLSSGEESGKKANSGKEKISIWLPHVSGLTGNLICVRFLDQFSYLLTML